MRRSASDTKICRATIDDLAFLNKLNDQVHSAGNVFGVPIYGDISEGHNTAVFVAKNKGKIAGFASVKIVDSRDQRLASIEHFGINPKFRRLRIGNKLLGVVNAFLINNKVAMGFLSSTNKGLPFYRHSNWSLADKKNKRFTWAPKPVPRARKKGKI